MFSKCSFHWAAPQKRRKTLYSIMPTLLQCTINQKPIHSPSSKWPHSLPDLFSRYGGPDSVQISDAFTLGWGAYLTTNRSIIYGLIDGRGSGLKGDKLKFSVYRRLGTVEIFDQIEVTAWVHMTQTIFKVAEIVNKLATFCQTGRFLFMFTTSLNCILFWVSGIKSKSISCPLLLSSYIYMLVS